MKLKVFAAAALAAVMLVSCSSADSSSQAGGQQNDTSTSAERERKDLEGNVMEKYKDQIVEIPPDGYDGKDRSLTYGEFKKYTYYSNTAERETPVNVMLPVDYSEDRKYPVLYILHGFWDTQDWMARPVVSLPKILGNLQAKGEAEEMIVVLPYIFCSKELKTCTGMDAENSLAYDNFINDLETDLIPFINKTFSVAEGRENTAITGFSMGGRESLFIGLKHPEQFGYIGAVCPAPGLIEIPGSPMHSGQLLESEMVFPEDQKPYILMISSSKADNVVSTSPDSYRQAFTKNGVEFLSHELKLTAHDHTSVKPHLYNFLRTLFH